MRPEFTCFGAYPPDVLKQIHTSFVEGEAMFSMLLETRPQVASFDFGLPRIEWVRALCEAGVFLLSTATRLEEAQTAVAAAAR